MESKKQTEERRALMLCGGYADLADDFLKVKGTLLAKKVLAKAQKRTYLVNCYEQGHLPVANVTELEEFEAYMLERFTDEAVSIKEWASRALSRLVTT